MADNESMSLEVPMSVYNDGLPLPSLWQVIIDELSKYQLVKLKKLNSSRELGAPVMTNPRAFDAVSGYATYDAEARALVGLSPQQDDDK